MIRVYIFSLIFIHIFNLYFYLIYTFSYFFSIKHHFFSFFLVFSQHKHLEMLWDKESGILQQYKFQCRKTIKDFSGILQIRSYIRSWQKVELQTKRSHPFRYKKLVYEKYMLQTWGYLNYSKKMMQFLITNQARLRLTF